MSSHPPTTPAPADDRLLADLEEQVAALIRLADSAESVDRLGDAIQARSKAAALVPALANARAQAELRSADPVRRAEILAERAARDGSYVAAANLTEQANALRAAARDAERRRELLETGDGEMLAEVLAAVEGLPLSLREQLFAGLAARFVVELGQAVADAQARETDE